MKIKEYNRFEFRFEKQLLIEMERVAKIKNITKTRLVKMALQKAVECFSEGNFHYRSKSDFLCRLHIPDKERFEVVLNFAEREVLRKLAFTWRISQAEVLRLAIEYYVYVVLGKKPVDKSVYSRKTRYSVKKPAPMLITYDIMNIFEARFHMLDPPKAWYTKIIGRNISKIEHNLNFQTEMNA